MLQHNYYAKYNYKQYSFFCNVMFVIVCVLMKVLPNIVDQTDCVSECFHELIKGVLRVYLYNVMLFVEKLKINN